MRRLLAASAALALALPCMALADDDHGHGHGRNNGHRAEAQAHGRGHQAEAHQGRFEGRNFAENRDRRDYERRDSGRYYDRGREGRGRHFTYRGREYAAVRSAAYRYPRGWGYRAWHRGDVLPRLFVSAPYFIDYAYLGLPPPPPGTRWVRYGPDALLIDLYNGRVADVIYGAFY